LTVSWPSIDPVFNLVIFLADVELAAAVLIVLNSGCYCKSPVVGKVLIIFGSLNFFSDLTTFFFGSYMNLTFFAFEDLPVKEPSLR
jgi:hypothetical protein